MVEEIKSGNNDKAALFEKYGSTYLRMYKAADHCINLVAQTKPKPYTRTIAPKNGIWFGEAGCGKTYGAEQVAIDNGKSMFKIPIAQLKKGWYDGYQGEEIVLFDDFRGSSMEPQEFLNLLDGIAQFPIKGGHVQNKASVLFFTSPDHPINWWPKWYAKTPNNWKQVQRRLNVVYNCTKDEQGHHATETDISESEIYKNQIETFFVK